MEIDNIAIIREYYAYAMPLDMLARKHQVSKHYVLDLIHYHIVGKPYEIMESRKILKELEQ